MLLNKGGEKPWHVKEKVKEKVVGKVNKGVNSKWK